MSPLARLPLASIFAGTGVWFWFEFDEPYRHVACGLGILIGFVLIAAPGRKSVLRFGSLAWNENELCRHILITGDTGCGKTSSGFHSILVQLTKTISNWGGLVLGVKGDEHGFLAELMAANRRSEDVVHLEVRPHGALDDWQPTHRYNLLSDRSLPWTTHAKAIVDTGASLTEGRQDSFFKPMAQISLANALQLLDEIGVPVTITRAYQVLTARTRLEEALDRLEHQEPSERRIALMEFFQNTFIETKAAEQREGIEGTIKTYLSFFLDPDIAEVFCSEESNTFEISDVDEGAVISVTLPQRFVTERRYVNTYLKMLFYYHALRRYDLPKSDQRARNMLLLLADEYQDIVTASEDGISDHKIIDRVRGARCAIIAGMQSEVSADPGIGRDKRKVLSLNFRTRFIFRGADMEGAMASADFIGKKKIWKRSKTHKAFSSVTYTRREEEDYKIKPAKLMDLKDHVAVVVHPSKRFVKKLIAPLDARGRVEKWYRR
jgi:hypothetical protein